MDLFSSTAVLSISLIFLIFTYVVYISAIYYDYDYDYQYHYFNIIYFVRFDIIAAYVKGRDHTTGTRGLLTNALGKISSYHVQEGGYLTL